jgi:uncharacterized protein (TIGR02646 family)
MRKLHRTNLLPRQTAYLAKKQREVNGGADVQKTWKLARKTKTMNTIAESLESMTGVRARCFFCGDSMGGEIEHYRPKSKYAHYAFDWDNLLLSCGPCNRKKLNRFRLLQGNPLLVDPTSQDPWDDLYFEENTGHITPRYIGNPPHPSPRGRYTLSIIRTLKLEAVTEGRCRVFRNLARVIKIYLQSPRGAPDRLALKQGLEDNDDYGLLEWFFLKEGSRIPPFNDLQAFDPVVWQKLVTAISAGVTGVRNVTI